MLKLKKKPYDLLDISSLKINVIYDILNLAKEIKNLQNFSKIPILNHKNVISLFYEPSTRTQFSFKMATENLNGKFTYLSSKRISEKKGENFIHTIKVLESINTDILILRHFIPGISHFLSGKCPFAIINAGDGLNEHPSQALMDLFTISESIRIDKPLNILFTGDCFYSRTFRSNLFLFQKLNFNISIFAPDTLIDPYLKKMNIFIKRSFKDALKDVDVIYCSRIQTERNKFLNLKLFKNSKYTLTLERYKRYATKDALVMHPGPINQNIELSVNVENEKIFQVWQQVKNSIPVRMAILKWIDNQL